MFWFVSQNYIYSYVCDVSLIYTFSIPLSWSSVVIKGIWESFSTTCNEELKTYFQCIYSCTESLYNIMQQPLSANQLHCTCFNFDPDSIQVMSITAFSSYINHLF